MQCRNQRGAGWGLGTRSRALVHTTICGRCCLLQSHLLGLSLQIHFEVDLVLVLCHVVTNHLNIGRRGTLLLTSSWWCLGFVTSMTFLPPFLRVRRFKASMLVWIRRTSPLPSIASWLVTLLADILADIDDCM